MFFQNAFKGENEVWKWILTPFLTLVAYGLGQIPLTIVLGYYMFKDGNANQYTPEEIQELIGNLDFAALGMDSNLTLFLMLLIFVFMVGALIFFLKIFHKRNWKSLITPLENINWSKIMFGFLLWGGMSLVLEGVSYFSDPSVYTLTFDPMKFLPLLAIVILLMPIQTSTEELFFRGYLMQGFGLWTRNKIVPLIVTSALFGLMHIMNPEVEKFGLALMMTYYMRVGFFLGLITIMDDSLELALGVHAATNMFSALFVSYSGGALQTDAVFRTDEVNVGLMIPVFFVLATIFFIICWRKYKWVGWSKLTEPIEEPMVKPQL